jgi:hypothetical protein
VFPLPSPFAHGRTTAVVLAALTLVGPALAQSPIAECVDLLAIDRFFHWPEIVSVREAEVTRAVLVGRYPELPPILASLRPAHAARHNAGELERLRLQSRDGIDFATARRWLRAVQSNPVACLGALSKFERGDGRQIGFCYGRAHAAYLEARAAGFPEASMRKIFLVGELVGPTSRWDFHSALAVAGDNPEGWWMEDAVLPEPVLPSEWLRVWTREKAQDPDELALLFVAPPTQLVRDPRLTVRDAVASDVVGPYFRALLRTYGIDDVDGGPPENRGARRRPPPRPSAPEAS